LSKKVEWTNINFELTFWMMPKNFLTQLTKRAERKSFTTFGKHEARTTKNCLKNCKTYYRLFAFWDKTDKQDTIVVSTHGIIKKTDKGPKKEIDKAERLRQQYFNDKNKGK